MLKTVETSPLPSSPSQGFTAGELAEIVRGPDDPDTVAVLGAPADRSTINERIRHWTRLGLLSPLGPERYPGTGVHRRYGAEVAVDAAILNALADGRIQVREDTIFALEQARQAFLDWKMSAGAGHIYFLTVDGRNSFWEDISRPMEARPIASAVRIQVCLNTIFDTLSRRLESGDIKTKRRGRKPARAKA
jgi:hypothetical protein